MIDYCNLMRFSKDLNKTSFKFKYYLSEKKMKK